MSGAAAFFLAKYPDWTPDQVKGALLLDADVPSGYNSKGSLGLGVIDAASWSSAASANASWASASWSSASWASSLAVE